MCINRVHLHHSYRRAHAVYFDAHITQSVLHISVLKSTSVCSILFVSKHIKHVLRGVCLIPRQICLYKSWISYKLISKTIPINQKQSVKSLLQASYLNDEEKNLTWHEALRCKRVETEKGDKKFDAVKSDYN